MSIPAERHMVLKTLYVELRRETRVMLEFFSGKDDGDIRHAIQASLDRVAGILDRLEQGIDLTCDACREPMPVKDLRELELRRVCSRCRSYSDMKMKAAQAVRMHRQAQQGLLQIG